MPENKLTSHLQLHLIVFIWGFTAVLGALIKIKEAHLVWFRMLYASIFLLAYLLFTKKSFRLPINEILKLMLVGFLIALHWIFFFKAINISNVSITLAMFSVGAFMASLLEPLFFGRKILWYEVFFGLIIIVGLTMIMKVEIHYLPGMLCALFSIFIGVVFTLLNGKLIQKHDSTIIALYEFISGFAFVTVYLMFERKFDKHFFDISLNDLVLILLLASVCTAYAFTASVNVMKKLSPYTVMLTTNLEPVYGIFIAYFIIGGNEKMNISFYIGTVI
ncbi:MAG: DMT family transporter, partial [Flavobacterium sp.]|nr:DMT family transporter [Flavobacterium sp.]